MKYLWLWCGVWMATALAGQAAVKQEAIPTPGSAYRPVEVTAWETGTVPRAVPFYRQPVAMEDDMRYVPTPAAPAPSSGNFLMGGARPTAVASPGAGGYTRVPTQSVEWTPAPAVVAPVVPRPGTSDFVMGGRSGAITSQELPRGAKLNYGAGTTTTLDMTGVAPNYQTPGYSSQSYAAPALAAPASSGNFLMGSRALPAGEKLPAAYSTDRSFATPSARVLPPAAPAYAAAAPMVAPGYATAPTARGGTVDFVMGGGPAPAAASYGTAGMAAPAYTAPAYSASGVAAPAYAAPAYTAPAQTGGFITGGRNGAATANYAGTLATPSGGVRLFLAPFHNATADEHAGRAMTELAATALLERGINLIQTEAMLARSRQENAAGQDGLYLDAARSIQATHLLVGTVHEYRFKTDLDGSPAVGITVRLVSAADGATLWQGTVAKSSRFFGSLSRVALGAAREMAGKVPLDVVGR